MSMQEPREDAAPDRRMVGDVRAPSTPLRNLEKP